MILGDQYNSGTVPAVVYLLYASSPLLNPPEGPEQYRKRRSSLYATIAVTQVISSMTTGSARHTKEQGKSGREVEPPILIPSIDANEEKWALQLGYYIEVLKNPHSMLERIERFQEWLSSLEIWVGTLACQEGRTPLDRCSARASAEPRAGEGK